MYNVMYAVLKLTAVFLLIFFLPMNGQGKDTFFFLSGLIGTKAFAASPAQNSPPDTHKNTDEKQSSQNIRIWKENGKIRATNTHFPEKSETIEAVQKNTPEPPRYDTQEARRKTEQKKEHEKKMRELQRTIKQYEANKQQLIKQQAKRRETPFHNIMGHAVIPVVFGYNGRETTVYMMLDTGATVTSVPRVAIDPLRITNFDTDYAQVADGRRIKILKTRVDYVKVGPFIKRNFLIATFPSSKKKKQPPPKDAEALGLLGMNFLQNHPFTLDHARQAIIWWQ